MQIGEIVWCLATKKVAILIARRETAALDSATMSGAGGDSNARNARVPAQRFWFPEVATKE